MPVGLGFVVSREAFTVAPDVVYSPILLLPSFATNRSDPDTAIEFGSLSPVIRDALTVAPDKVYSPIVPWPAKLPLTFDTNRSDPDMASPDGSEPARQRNQCGGGLPLRTWCIR